MISKNITINIPTDMEARPVALLVQVASQFESNIYVEVLEVKQEESTNNTREQLRAHGFDLTPRKQTDRGGILCLPLDKNLNGDVQAKHPDWEPVECPTCGRKCWKHPEAGRLAKEQGAKMICTECAIKAGLLSPFRKEGPNRAQRRRAKRERRK